MTVTSEITSVSYATDGTTATFPVPFLFYAKNDLKLTLVDNGETSAGNFSASGVGNPTGGSVTLNATPAAGKTLRIDLDPPFTQLTAYTDRGRFPAASHERALDRNIQVSRATDNKRQRLEVRSVRSLPGQLQDPIDQREMRGNFLIGDKVTGQIRPGGLPDVADIVKDTIFDIYPVPGWQDRLAYALTKTDTPSFRFGTYDLYPTDAARALSLLNLTNKTIDGQGSTLMINWNPLSGVAPPKAMEIKNNFSPRFKNWVIAYKPHVVTKGLVVDKTATTIKIRVPVGLEPDWPTMDTYASVDRYGGVTNWQYFTDDSHRSYPYPIARTTGAPAGFVDFIITTPGGGGSGKPITACTSKNPLTFTIPGHGFGDGQRVRPVGVTGLGSALSGGIYVRVGGTGDSGDDNGEMDTVVMYSVKTGAPIDASAFPDWGATGYLEAFGPEEWIIPNVTNLITFYRKRGGNPIEWWDNDGDSVLDVRVRESAAVTVIGRGGKGTLQIRVLADNDGPLTSCAGVINLNDFEGTMEVPEFIVRGHGDDAFNTFTKFVDYRHAPVVSGGNMLKALWTTTLSANNPPRLPKIGHELEFWNSSMDYQASMFVYAYDPTDPLRVVLTSDPTLATLTGTIPAGFNPANWRIINRSLVPALSIGLYRSYSALTAGFVAQSHDIYCADMKIVGSFAEALRISLPGSGTSSNGGTRGGISIKALQCMRNCMRPHQTKGAVIFTRRSDSAGNIAVGDASIYKPVELGDVTMDTFGYGGVASQGFDININSLTVRSPGILRSNLNNPAAAALMSRSLWANGSTIRITQLRGVELSDMGTTNGGKIYVNGTLVAG